MIKTGVEACKVQIERKVMIYETVLKSDILSENFADNLVIDASQLPPPNNEINYELAVDFSHKRIHDEAQIMAFPVEDRPYIKNSIYKDRIGYALSKQLSNIESRFTGFGYDFANCSINGQAFEDTSEIIIRLFEGKAKEFDKKGKPTEMKVYSIAPSVPGLNKIIAETCAEFALKREKEMEMEEKKRKEHIPNYIDVSELLELVACGIFLDQRSTKENKSIRIQDEATKLMACFNVEKEWPLEMAGHIGQKSSENRPLQQVDCSEWLVYSQDRDGKWSLKAFESADMARNSVEKGIVNRLIDTIIVLHDLLPISYSIMAKSKYGLSLVDKKDAHKHKRVQVVWGNTSNSKADMEVSSF